MQLTRLSRLFFVFLISVVLPFTNVAATAMPHYAQPMTVSPLPAPEAAVADGSMHHAHHHHMQAAQDMGNDHCDQQQHHSSSEADCNHCSYCQSCSFVMALPLAGQGFPDEAAVSEKFRIADPAPQLFHEQPFHPPRYAFA